MLKLTMKENLRAFLLAFRNIVTTINLIKIPLVLYPKKLLGLVQSELFLFKTICGKRKLIQKNVYEVLNSQKKNVEIKINLPNKWFLSDCFYTKDILSLCITCQILNPKVIFEIGTLDGYTAYHFALNTSKETKIYTLDLPKNKTVSPELNITIVDKFHIKAYRSKKYLIYEGEPEESKIINLYGDSYKFDYSPYYKKVDFFFIDGAHSYEYVRSDTLNALKCVRRGGVIAWHDYGRVGVNGVSKWLHELARYYEIFSVPGSSVAFMKAE